MNSLALQAHDVNWIEHVCEPRRLLLAWQAPDHFEDRFRWAVGELAPTSDGFSFRYFGDGEEFQLFNRRGYEQLVDLGFKGYPAFRLMDKPSFLKNLDPFLRRLPPRSRSDFPEYRKNFKLAPEAEISDFALLGLTEAKLPSDGFSLVDTLSPAAPRCELFLEVAGYRYYAENAPLPAALGESAEFLHEPLNEHDPNAVMVKVRGTKIGYVNRLQAGTFLKWMSARRVSAVVERLNGDRTRPRVYLFIEVA